MSRIDPLLQANAGHVSAPWLAAQPASGVAVITCMDARIDVLSLLGARPGDLHVLRNAGAAVTDDVIRSLLVSQRMLGTESVMLIAHSRCGMSGLDAEAFAEDVRRDSGQTVPFDLEAFSQVEAHVRKGLRRLRDAALLPHRDDIRGFVLDIDTGRLREVSG